MVADSNPRVSTLLRAVTWTEVLDITEKLFEAADEIEPG